MVAANIQVLIWYKYLRKTVKAKKNYQTVNLSSFSICLHWGCKQPYSSSLCTKTKQKTTEQTLRQRDSWLYNSILLLKEILSLTIILLVYVYYSTEITSKLHRYDSRCWTTLSCPFLIFDLKAKLKRSCYWKQKQPLEWTEKR